MHKTVNSVDNGAREQKLGSFDGGDHGEHKSIDLVEIHEILAAQDNFFNEMAPVSRGHLQ